jgi:uncharacterized small protein (DUF1192 family)
MFFAEEVAEAIAERDRRIGALEAENKRLKAAVEHKS